MDELYRDEDLVVRRIPSGDPARWVVTFDNHSIGAGFDRPGFGEEYLRQNKISAIHVLGRGNDWYQYPGIEAATASVRRATADARHVVAYGSSMGGYAAIRFATAIGATAVIALSPQYSNDPLLVPWENRWPQEAGNIQWLPELRSAIACPCRPIVLFDPTLELDRRHVALIAADTGCDLVPIPFAGHPVTIYLHETGLLGEIVQTALAGTLDIAALRLAVRAARRRSSVYLGTLAERQPKWRLSLALRLARMAAAALPGGTLGMLSLARVLTKLGQHDEALALHRQILTIAQRADVYLVPFANALLAAGDRVTAAAIAGEVVGNLPEVAHLRNWHAGLLWRAGLRRDAIAEEKIAVSLDSKNSAYRRYLLMFRFGAPFFDIAEGFRTLLRTTSSMRWSPSASRARRHRR